MILIQMCILLYIFNYKTNYLLIIFFFLILKCIKIQLKFFEIIN